MNPNYNVSPKTGKRILGSETMANHACWVWSHIKAQNFKNLMVIAHSAGGSCTEEIIRKYQKDFLAKTRYLALTDANYINFNKLSKEMEKFASTKVTHF
jgi:hypothetical protein